MMDNDIFDATQAIYDDELDDETDSEEFSISQKIPVGYLKVQEQKGLEKKEYPVFEGDNIIGRHESCQVCIPSKSLSKEHACIVVKNGCHLIYDKGSRNKTKRGKLFLLPDVRYELGHQNQLVFADLSCTYVIVAQSKTAKDRGSEATTEKLEISEEEAEGDAGCNLPDTSATVLVQQSDEDWASDTSIDILQPTQPWDDAVGLQKSDVKNEEAGMVSGNFSSVMETPDFLKRPLDATATLVLPESGSETDDEGISDLPPKKLIFHSEDDQSGNDSAILTAATQAMGDRAAFAEETQMYEASDDEEMSSGSDVDLEAETQAIQHKYSPKGKESSPRSIQQKARGKIQMTTDKDACVTKTQMYDMDPDSEFTGNRAVNDDELKEAQGKFDNSDSNESDSSHSLAITSMETQKLEDQSDEDGKFGKSKGNRKVKKLLPEMTMETQKIEDVTDVNDKLKAILTRETQKMDDTTESDREEENESYQLMGLFSESTLACEVSEDESEDDKEVATNNVNFTDATQVMDGTKHVEDADEKPGQCSGSKDAVDNATVLLDDTTVALPTQTENSTRPIDNKFSESSKQVDNKMHSATVPVKSMAHIVSKPAVGNNSAKKIFDSDCAQTTMPTVPAECNTDGATMPIDAEEDSDMLPDNLSRSAVSEPDNLARSAVSESDTLPVTVINSCDDNTQEPELADSDEEDEDPSEHPGGETTGKNGNLLAAVDDTVCIEEDASQPLLLPQITPGSDISEDDTPELVPESPQNEESTALIKIPERSPFKPTLVDPTARRRSPSPKSVAFAEPEEKLEEAQETKGIIRGRKRQSRQLEKYCLDSAEGQVRGRLAKQRRRGKYEESPKSKTADKTEAADIIQEKPEVKPAAVADQSICSDEVLKPPENKMQNKSKPNPNDKLDQSTCSSEAKFSPYKVQQDKSEPRRSGRVRKAKKFADDLEEKEVLKCEETGTEVNEPDAAKSKAEYSAVISKEVVANETSLEASPDVIDTNTSHAQQTFSAEKNEEATKAEAAADKAEDKSVSSRKVQKTKHRTGKSYPPNARKSEKMEIELPSLSEKIETKMEMEEDSTRDTSLRAGRLTCQKVMKNTDTAAPRQLSDNITTELTGNNVSTIQAAASKESEVISKRTGRNKSRKLASEDQIEDMEYKIKVVAPVLSRSSRRQSRVSDPKAALGSNRSRSRSHMRNSVSSSAEGCVDKNSHGLPLTQKKESTDDEKKQTVPDSDASSNTKLVVEDGNQSGRRGRGGKKGGKSQVKNMQSEASPETIGENMWTESNKTPGESEQQKSLTSCKTSQTSGNVEMTKQLESADGNQESKKKDLQAEQNSNMLRSSRRNTGQHVENKVSSSQDSASTRKGQQVKKSLSTGKGVCDDKEPDDSSQSSTSRRSLRRQKHQKDESLVESETHSEQQSENLECLKIDVHIEPQSKDKSLARTKKGQQTSKARGTKSIEKMKSELNTKSEQEVETLLHSENITTRQLTEESLQRPISRRGQSKKSTELGDSQHQKSENSSQSATPKRPGRQTKKKQNTDTESPVDQKAGGVALVRRGRPKKQTQSADRNLSTDSQRREESIPFHEGRRNAKGVEVETSRRSKRKVQSAESENIDGPTPHKAGEVEKDLEIQEKIFSTPTRAKCPRLGAHSNSKSPAHSGSKVDKGPIHSPSLRRSSLSSKPKILFTGVIDEHGHKDLWQVIKELGGEIAQSVQECTHLITDKIRRTVKFLCGVARGVIIVTPQWLDSCKSANMFIDPSRFVVHDSAVEKQYKFSLEAAVRKAAHSPLLQGFHIHVTKSVRPEPEQMKEILECTGAEWLANMPKKAADKTVIISCEEDKSACATPSAKGIDIVSAEFILTGVLRQEVDIENHFENSVVK